MPTHQADSLPPIRLISNDVWKSHIMRFRFMVALKRFESCLGKVRVLVLVDTDYYLHQCSTGILHLQKC